MFCAKCGAELPEDTKFCSRCGAPVATASAAPAPAQSRNSAADPALLKKFKSTALIASILGMLFVLFLPLITGGSYFGAIGLFQLGDLTRELEVDLNGGPFVFGYLFCLAVMAFSTWLIWKRDWWYFHIAGALVLIFTQSGLTSYIRSEAGYTGSTVSSSVGYILPLIGFLGAAVLMWYRKRAGSKHA